MAPLEQKVEEVVEHPHKESALLQADVREWWTTRVMGPIERICVRYKISPNQITYAAMALCFVCFGLYATGHILTAGWLVLVVGSLDALDGRVARVTNQVTDQGAFLDSVLDRYQDFLIFAGLAVLYKESWVFYVVLTGLAGTMFVPYVRAKADGLGIDLAKVGGMQRPERVFLVGFGSMVSSVFQVSLMPFYGKGNPPPQHVLILILILLAVSSHWTALQRIRYSMGKLSRKEK